MITPEEKQKVYSLCTKYAGAAAAEEAARNLGKHEEFMSDEVQTAANNLVEYLNSITVAG